MNEQDATPKRPWTVTAAYYMLWLWLLSTPGQMAIVILGNWEAASRWWWSEGVKNDMVIAPTVIIITFFWLMLTLVAYAVGRGRNGARIVFLIVLLLDAPCSVQEIIRLSGDSPLPGQWWEIFQLEILILAVALLFQRTSSDWFKAVERLLSKNE